MSLDLYQDEAVGSLSNLAPTKTVERGAWDNFFVGAGKVAMRELAKAGRAVDLLGSVGPIIKDKINGNTELSDQYFKEHEEVFQKAVDYWAPSPHEVGVAGEVVGSLLGTLPLVFASPAFAVGATQLGQAEDLTRQGVDPTKAQAVGAVQAVGLGTGIWMPILGQTLAQRVLLGGAGFNVLQGVATRAVSGEILEGTPQADQYKAFDPTSMTIDVLLGMAFGGMAHLNPQQRAQGAEFLGKMKEWAENLSPSDKDALAVLRQGQHINEDTLPGKPVSDADLTAHVDRVRTAIEQLATDKPVSVEDMPAPRVEADPVRTEESAARVEEIRAMAESPVFGDIHTLPKEAQPKAIEDAVTRALTDIGRSPEEASAAGQLWSSFFKTAGERYGIAPAELLRKYGVDIRAIDQAPEGGMRLDQEGNVKTNTPEFRNWFGDSKVVDAEGKPLVVYHATSADFSDFRTKGNERQGFPLDAAFFAETPAAAREHSTSARMVKAYVSIKNPRIATMADDDTAGNAWRNPMSEQDEIVAARAAGNDGVIFVNDTTGERYFAAFDPTQIKSVNNRGTFDPNDPNILHQPAYHGSPYKFDKFSLEHLGKGEGAQAYGWGLYFAGKKGVAEHYRQQLSDNTNGPPQRFFKGQELTPGTPEYHAATLMSRSGQTVPRARKEVAEWIADAETWSEQRKSQASEQAVLAGWKRTLEVLNEAASKKDFTEKPYQGQLYKVNIPDEGQYLLWDKPLSEQPEAVKAALLPAAHEVFVNEPRFNPDYTDGKTLYWELRRQHGSDESASKYLNSLGVAGIKYLDGTSRDKGEGSFNYVIFDDSAVQILNTYYQGNRGLIKLDNGQTLIGLFDAADKSTFLHESGHFFLEVTHDLATKEGAPMAAMQDWATLSKWLGIEGGDIPRAAHEKFAEGFEQYLMEGKAPNEQLRGVFQQFRDWLVSIYQKVKADLSDDVRGVMDRMLAMSDTEKAVKAAAREASVAGMDPVTAEAYRLAQENPDVRIPVGTDANGEPIHQTVTEYLDAARADAEQARADSTLFEVAATCMLGRA